MNILITGGSGLLGQYLNLILSKENEIFTLYNTNTGNCKDYRSYKVKITDFNLLNKLFESFRPDAVIHTACFSRPETCDAADPNLVWKTNAEATKFISELCEKFNSKLIYTSTDLVYDGEQGGMLKENSLLNPLSLYAKTKLTAEGEIQKTTDNYIILRTSLLIGIGLNHSRNNFHLMYDNFKSGKKSRLFTDQFRTPLALSNAAEIINRLCKSDIKSKIFNFGGIERISRAGIGELLCDVCSFDKNLIEEISLNDVENKAKVKDVSLNTDFLQSFGFEIHPLKESIKESLSYINL